MPRDDEVFREALVGKKIPILTLDNQWHKLFTQAGENEEIQALEEELNELLKRQGKANTELKSLNSLKKKLMQEIVSIMELLYVRFQIPAEPHISGPAMTVCQTGHASHTRRQGRHTCHMAYRNNRTGNPVNA